MKIFLKILAGISWDTLKCLHKRLAGEEMPSVKNEVTSPKIQVRKTCFLHVKSSFRNHSTNFSTKFVYPRKKTSQKTVPKENSWPILM